METVACPHCSGEILDDPALAGQKIECPHCGKKVKMLERPAVKPAAARSPTRGGTPGRVAKPSDSQAIQITVGNPPAETTAIPEPAPETSGFAIDTSARAAHGPSTPKPGHASPAGQTTVTRPPPTDNSWIFWRVGAVGGAILIGILLFLFQMNAETPTDPRTPGGALYHINLKASKGDWAGVYDSLAKQTRRQLATVAPDRNAFAQEMRRNADPRMKFSANPRVASETREGNRATVTVRNGPNGTMTFQMVWEDGAWRLIL